MKSYLFPVRWRSRPSNSSFQLVPFAGTEFQQHGVGGKHREKGGEENQQIEKPV